MTNLKEVRIYRFELRVLNSEVPDSSIAGSSLTPDFSLGF